MRVLYIRNRIYDKQHIQVGNFCKYAIHFMGRQNKISNLYSGRLRRKNGRGIYAVKDRCPNKCAHAPVRAIKQWCDGRKEKGSRIPYSCKRVSINRDKSPRVVLVLPRRARRAREVQALSSSSSPSFSAERLGNVFRTQCRTPCHLLSCPAEVVHLT